ncbi:IucA/IucC family protein [Paenibacillus xerothermodurans]|uniref:IucA/IucC family protein n=1 Tax=Paenibacillus xerothermodurans TaxID=1977292 RepID=UPI00140334BC|nr:IucA/IucC family protein [Paenibacillus xerothermodurans]
MLFSQERLQGCLRAEEGMLNRLFNVLLREPVLTGDWRVSAAKPDTMMLSTYSQSSGAAEIKEWLQLSHGDSQHALLMPILHRGAFERYELAYPVWRRQNTGWEPITCVEQWIEWMAEAGMSVPTSVVRELLNSRDNLRMAYESLEQKQVWAHHQQSTVLAFHHQQRTNNLLAFIDRLKQCKPFDELVYSESLAIEGHPLHPLTKTKWGLSKPEVRRYAPEFEQPLHVRTVLVRKDKVRWTQTCFGSECELLLGDTTEVERLLQGLEPVLSPEVGSDYVLFPVHPWQYEHMLPRLFVDELSRKEIIPIPYVMSGSATLSFRTVALNEGSGRHVKLPVAAQATSAVRTVSPEITVNGPKLSAMLRRIWDREGDKLGRADFIEEMAGAYFTNGSEEDTARSRHLAFLVRENPRRYMRQGDFGFVAASLTASSPLCDRPVIMDWMETYYGDRTPVSPSQVLDYLKQYALVLLRPLVRLLQQYGIALEAHMQNTIICTSNGKVTQALFRDLGGIRVHRGRFEAGYGTSLQTEGLAGASIFTNDMEEVYSKFVHAVLQNHMGDLIFCLRRQLQMEETLLWKAVRAVLEECFDKSHPHFEADWQAVTRTLVRTKALFNMRVSDTAKSYLYTEVTNPIAGLGL